MFPVPVLPESTHTMEFLNYGTVLDMEDRVIAAIKTCYDPEIPVDVYELGLIYKVEVKADNSIFVDMTLTSPNCPSAGTLPGEVESLLKGIEGVPDAVVDVVFEPTWDKSMMSEVAMLELGFM
jgi:FeS assembly SUF system protein